MDRVERSEEKYKQLFGNGVSATYATDPEFQDILSRFILKAIEKLDDGGLWNRYVSNNDQVM